MPSTSEWAPSLFEVRAFRATTPGVVARIVELQRASYALEAELIGFSDIPPLHEVEGDVLGLELDWIGAFENDSLIGGLGYVDRDGYRDIDRLFVAPPRTQRGVGRALVQRVLDVAEVRVSTGTANTPAVKLYISLGFTRSGQREIAPGVTVTEFVYKAG